MTPQDFISKWGAPVMNQAMLPAVRQTLG